MSEVETRDFSVLQLDGIHKIVFGVAGDSAEVVCADLYDFASFAVVSLVDIFVFKSDLYAVADFVFRIDW